MYLKGNINDYLNMYVEKCMSNVLVHPLLQQGILDWVIDKQWKIVAYNPRDHGVHVEVPEDWEYGVTCFLLQRWCPLGHKVKLGIDFLCSSTS